MGNRKNRNRSRSRNRNDRIRKNRGGKMEAKETILWILAIWGGISIPLLIGLFTTVFAFMGAIFYGWVTHDVDRGRQVFMFFVLNGILATLGVLVTFG